MTDGAVDFSDAAVARGIGGMLSIMPAQHSIIVSYECFGADPDHFAEATHNSTGNIQMGVR